MSEARNIIILVLVLLFIFVGVGVAISRLNKKTAEQGKKADTGFIQQIFGDFAALKRVTPTSTPTPTPGTVIVTKESTGETVYTFAGTVTPVVAKSGISVQTDTSPGSKGSQPTSIPSTGASPTVVLLALIGLAGGLYLHRRS